MTTIKPISELRNYPDILKEVKVGAPVYLTKNGAGFWFESMTAGSITVAGEGKVEASAVVDRPDNKFFIMSNPFP